MEAYGEAQRAADGLERCDAAAQALCNAGSTRAGLLQAGPSRMRSCSRPASSKQLQQRQHSSSGGAPCRATRSTRRLACCAAPLLPW